MTGRDCDVNLRASNHPEFDAWRWHDYWVPLDMVIEFKREVYQLALQELSRFLSRPERAKPRHTGRYLRQQQTFHQHDKAESKNEIAADSSTSLTKANEQDQPT